MVRVLLILMDDGWTDEGKLGEYPFFNDRLYELMFLEDFSLSWTSDEKEGTEFHKDSPTYIVEEEGRDRRGRNPHTQVQYTALLPSHILLEGGREGR